MTIELERPDAPGTLARTGVDWERHAGHGGPKIKRPPGLTEADPAWSDWLGRTGKPAEHRYYTRVTSFAKAIDDLNKLMAWKMRAVLVGVGQRPAYAVAAAALTLRPEDRDAGDELAEKAVQAAKGDDAALVGTAIHTWTERADRGEPLGYVPPQVQPLVDAYVQLTRPITFLHREVRTVCDELAVAGTPDGIGTCSIPDPDGVVEGLRIIDTKSGKVSYPGPMSCQLAAYARSHLYDPATGARTPLDGVNQRWGLIVHVQQGGEVPPGLYWLNLEHGHQGLELARQVRGWRKVRPSAILQPVDDVPVPVEDMELDTTEAGEIIPPEAFVNPADGQRQAVLLAAHTTDLERLWRDQGADWPEEVQQLAAARHAELTEQQTLAAPRAALAAALAGADGMTLHDLWQRHGATPVWTEEHAALAESRYRQLVPA